MTRRKAKKPGHFDLINMLLECEGEAFPSQEILDFFEPTYMSPEEIRDLAEGAKEYLDTVVSHLDALLERIPPERTLDEILKTEP